MDTTLSSFLYFMSLLSLITEARNRVSAAYPGSVLYEVQSGIPIDSIVNQFSDVISWRFSFVKNVETYFVVWNSNGWGEPHDNGGELHYRHLWKRSPDSEQYVVDSISNYDGDLADGIMDLDSVIPIYRASGWDGNISNIALIAPIVSTIPVPFYALHFDGSLGMSKVCIATNGFIKEKQIKTQGIISNESFGALEVS